jgi:hypothetical protein
MTIYNHDSWFPFRTRFAPVLVAASCFELRANRDSHLATTVAALNLRGSIGGSQPRLMSLSCSTRGTVLSPTDARSKATISVSSNEKEISGEILHARV